MRALTAIGARGRDARRGRRAGLVALAAGALLASSLPSPATAEGGASGGGDAQEQVYALDAGDGLPGRVRAALTLSEAGSYRLRAEWSGRPMAGLWIEDLEGHTLSRKVGPSPLELVLRFDPAGSGLPSRLTLRFAPTTSRGALKGTIRLTPPRRPPAAPPPAPPPPADPLLDCLRPALAPDGPGRALERLAAAAGPANEVQRSWLARWATELRELLAGGEDVRQTRRRIDTLWERLRLDQAPPGAVAPAFRAVLAASEDLLRREGARRAPPGLRARRAALAEALGCFGQEGEAEMKR